MVAEAGGDPEAAWAQAVGPRTKSTLKSVRAKVAGRSVKRFCRGVSFTLDFPEGLDAKLMISREFWRRTTTYEHSGFHREAAC